MSLDKEGGPENQFTFQGPDTGSVTNMVPSERDVPSYSVSDHELDSLSTFTTLPSVCFSLTVLFLTVGLGGIISLLAASWLFASAMLLVGGIFACFGVWSFHKKNTYINRIREESRPREPR